MIIFGKGKNDNDTTATHFKAGNIKSSDFYLFSTMKKFKS